MKPVYAQFGSGGNQLQGWHNHEQHDADITKPLPYAPNSVDKVLAEHVVEHVSGPDGFRFFQEVYRILKPGGVFYVCVPILDRLTPEHAIDIIVGHGHLMVYNKQNLSKMLNLAGFNDIKEPNFDPNLFGHWKVIGRSKDELETLRLECVK